MTTLSKHLAAFLTALLLYGLSAQEPENTEYRIAQWEKKKEAVIAAEKNSLKQKVADLNAQLAQGKINKKEAENLKKEAAEFHARNIENKIAILDNQIELLRRNGQVDLNDNPAKIELGLGSVDNEGTQLFGISINSGKQKFTKYDRRTYSNLVLAFGLNNALISGASFSDSPYRFLGSRFFEIGYTWNTRVFRSSNWLRIKYGFSFQFNGLKTDNQVFLEDPENLNAVELVNASDALSYDRSLKKSKLRMDSFVFPVYFEFGPSAKKEYGNYIRYSQYRQFKMGLGGYFGFNYNNVQKIKTEDNTVILDDMRFASTSRNLFPARTSGQRTVFGLGSYIGVGDISLYFKYELTEIFKGPSQKQNNISLGVRFDL